MHLFIIFIATRLSQFQFPRIPNFSFSKKFDKYVYEGRALTVEEFNEASKLVFSQGFKSDGFIFCPQAVEVSAEEHQAAVAKYAEKLEGQRIAREKEIAEREAAYTESLTTSQLEAELAAAKAAEREAAETAEREAIAERARQDEEARQEEERKQREAESGQTPEAGQESIQTSTKLELYRSGKSIYLGEERVAGLYGEEQSLRVFKEELRDQIVEFLKANAA
jgi:hypothetical protein